MQQHENLCRAYFKDVRKSGRTIREDWPQYWEYARRRGSIYGTVVGLTTGMGKRSTGSTGELLSEQDKHNLATGGMTDEKGRLSTSPRPTTPHGPERASKLDGTRSPSTDRPGRSTTPFSLTGKFGSKRASRAPTVYPRAAALTRTDLIASAERIFYRYLVPSSHALPAADNHEIYLPPALRIHSFLLSSTSPPTTQAELAMLAQIPDIFHQQKEYCFRAMEQDAFPRFLRSKAFGNLTPVSALVRLIAGLVILWIGLASGFSLVFLDIQPKSKRFFVSDVIYYCFLKLTDDVLSFSYHSPWPSCSLYLINMSLTLYSYFSASPKQRRFEPSPSKSHIFASYSLDVQFGSQSSYSHSRLLSR